MSTPSLHRTAAPLLSDEQVYRILFAATFLVFLAAVLLRRLGLILGGHAVASRKSILAETREIGSNTLLLAFMG